MGSYIPGTNEEQKRMLDAIGVGSAIDLYENVPKSIRLNEGDLKIAPGLSEMETATEMSKLAAKNHVFSSIFRGAGAYNHFIPSIVKRIAAKEAFVTAYTPYQPEISQGVLQSIFEYQTMIAELTGMDVSNASVYDGAVAAAEAATMCRERKRQVTLISAAAFDEVIDTVKTYCFGADAALTVIPEKDGKTDLAALKAALTDETASFYFQYPNKYGVIEDAEEIIGLVHAAGAKAVMGVNPIALGLLKTPGELGADIAVGDGQPLGMPLSFGGPYLGFMTAKKELTRKLPGRIVGQTQDADGNRCFVLTLQAREQHIRREKASSNICSNQALCALIAGAYMATMGFHGIEKAAKLSYDKAHYLASELCKLPGFALAYPDAPYFNEFVVKTPIDAHKLNIALEKEDILGGLPVKEGVLFCCTELNEKTDIDRLVACVKEAAK